jgi:hypothetical protein
MHFLRRDSGIFRASVSVTDEPPEFLGHVRGCIQIASPVGVSRGLFKRRQVFTLNVFDERNFQRLGIINRLFDARYRADLRRMVTAFTGNNEETAFAAMKRTSNGSSTPFSRTDSVSSRKSPAPVADRD